MNPLTEQQFRTALDSRDVIGQAKGIIMVRTRVNADAAFSMLVEMSQHSHVPVRIVAQELVDSLPGASNPPSRSVEAVITYEKTFTNKWCPACGQQQSYRVPVRDGVRQPRQGPNCWNTYCAENRGVATT